MGAFCRHAAGSSCWEDHTRFLCLENSAAYNYSFDHVKRAVTVHLNCGFAGNYQSEQGKETVRTTSPRKGLSYKFLFYSFFLYFNLYIFQPNCAAVRTSKSFQELLSLLLAKWKSCAVFAFGPGSCPKTALQRSLPASHWFPSHSLLQLGTCFSLKFLTQFGLTKHQSPQSYASVLQQKMKCLRQLTFITLLGC